MYSINPFNLKMFVFIRYVKAGVMIVFFAKISNYRVSRNKRNTVSKSKTMI